MFYQISHHELIDFICSSARLGQRCAFITVKYAPAPSERLTLGKVATSGCNSAICLEFGDLYDKNALLMVKRVFAARSRGSVPWSPSGGLTASCGPSVAQGQELLVLDLGLA